MQKINEVELRYKSRLIDQLEKYKGQGLWVHFILSKDEKGKVINKFGINPHPDHGDPAGIYFYYLDWLLDHPNFLQGDQYATERNNWVVVRLKPDATGIDLGKVRPERLLNILGVENEDEHIDSELFWKVLNHRADKNAVLSGIPYILDPNLGIIHWNEPYQLLVRDVRCIAIVDRGTQYKGGPDKIHSRNVRDGEMVENNIVVEFLKEVRKLYGGNIVWKDREPSLAFSHSGAEFVITSPNRYSRYIAMECRWGRAHHNTSVPLSNYTDTTKSMQSLVDYFTKTIEQVSQYAKREKDMFFTPKVSEREIITGIKSITRSPVKITTEIRNDSSLLQVFAEREYQEGKAALVSRIVVTTRTDSIEWSAYIKINQYHMLSVSATTLDGLVQKIPMDITSRLADFSKGGYGRYFYYDEDKEAFVGWMAEHSCIANIANSEQIEQYRKTEHGALVREISRVF